MLYLTKTGVATAVCAAVAMSALPTESRAGVMSVTDKTSVSLASLSNNVHWRAYHHRHWGGWRHGWRHYGWNPGWRYGWNRGGYPYRNYGFGLGYPYYGAYGFAGGVTAPVAADGNYCATPVKTCLLYEPGWLGTGCSCKVPDGHARGTVVVE